MTKYGTAKKRFNVITGEPDSKSYSVCPIFNTYANRLPLHLLPKESQAVVLQGGNVDKRPSEPRRAGWGEKPSEPLSHGLPRHVLGRDRSSPCRLDGGILNPKL